MGLYKDLANKIAKSRASEGGVYWEPGRYLVLIDLVKVKEGRESDYFIVEGENLESSNPERPVGTRCGWVLNVRKEPSHGNIKGFLAAALACNPDDITSKDFEDCIDEENPLNGRLVRLEVRLAPTKKGGEFSRHTWRAVEEDLYKVLDAMKKKAGL